MNKRLLAACLLSLAMAPSCRLMQQRVDLSWFSDVMTSPQSDSVVVEEGRGLPESAASAASAAQTHTPAPVASTASTPVAAAPVSTPAPAAPAASGKTYTVAKGDTLNAIAARQGCTPQALIAANGITNPNALKIGTVLNIPTAGAPAAPAATPPVATAPTGTASQPRKSGRSWKFWKQNAPAPQPTYYTVQPGDTLSGIARKNGTTLSAILAANGMTMAQANTLRIGQRIILPAAH